MTKFGSITREGGVEGCIYRVSHVPTARGGAQRSPILGFPSIYAYTVCHRTTKFD